MDKQIITQVIALLLLSCGFQVTPVADGRADEDWPAIENCLGIIRQCQMDDGMIRMKADGDPVWTSPYISNFAAIALLAANHVKQNVQDVARVERWLIWYARNQEADGTICDREGTTRAYTSNGKRDSTDAYAATFLMAAWRYKQAITNRPSAEIIRAAGKALVAVEAVVQQDGFTLAKPDYPVKYLMDNIEVYQGLTEAALLFGSLDMRKEEQRATETALRLAAGISKFWSEQDQCFAHALDMNDKPSVGFSRAYPDGLAQLFALSFTSPARPLLWIKVNQIFKPGDEGCPVERWLIAATRNAGRQERENLRTATREAALGFSSKNVYVDRPSMSVIALLDGKARFVDVPLFSKKE